MAISLKDVNRVGLAMVVVCNVMVFYVILTAGLDLEAISEAFAEYKKYASSAGVALLIGILNAQVGANTKARLVFWRLQHPLPGSRAFSEIMNSDPRIDPQKLRQHQNPLPTDPTEQNRLWYSWYRQYKADPSVLHVHREFLFSRDWAVLVVTLTVALGGIALWQMPMTHAGIYILLMVAQYLLVRRAAKNHGERFVATVLANKSAE